MGMDVSGNWKIDLLDDCDIHRSSCACPKDLLVSHLVFCCGVERAKWDESSPCWTLDFDRSLACTLGLVRIITAGPLGELC